MKTDSAEQLFFAQNFVFNQFENNLMKYHGPLTNNICKHNKYYYG